MKKKLFIALLVMASLSILVSVQVFSTMKDVTFRLENIIRFYKIQTIREKLSIQLHKVQDSLAIKDTPYKILDSDTIIKDVEEMDRIMHFCFDCHHEPDVDAELKQVDAKMGDFKTALSRIFTVRSSYSRFHAANEAAYKVSDLLLKQVDAMMVAANAKLEKRSRDTITEVLSITKVMTISLFVLPAFLLLAGFYFVRAISRPIATLMAATAKLGTGDMGVRVTGLKNEFGKLGDSFNVMAESLTNQVQIMQRAEQMTVVGQMAAGLAHEIKNPLAGIKVSMEVLRNEIYIHERDRQVLSMVIAVINRVNSLLNDLLNYARPQTPHLQSIPLNDLLQQAINSVSLSLTRPHTTETSEHPPIRCHDDLAPDLPNVSGDPGQLQQIFLNLIINAFEAMPQGGTVTISSSVEQGTALVVVTITDTGPGISDELRDKIFIPFFSTKRKGTGLGLAICKTLVEKSGGAIVANKNNADGGASISVFLPIASDQGTTA